MRLKENIERIYNQGKEIEIYLDMDGTITELIFDAEESFAKKGNYIKKVPIKPVIEKLEKIHNIYPNIKFNILSFSRNDDMTIEKNKWLDINMPYIGKESRVFLSEENKGYCKAEVNKIKGKYIKANITIII